MHDSRRRFSASGMVHGMLGCAQSMSMSRGHVRKAGVLATALFCATNAE